MSVLGTRAKSWECPILLTVFIDCLRESRINTTSNIYAKHCEQGRKPRFAKHLDTLKNKGFNVHSRIPPRTGEATMLRLFVRAALRNSRLDAFLLIRFRFILLFLLIRFNRFNGFVRLLPRSKIGFGETLNKLIDRLTLIHQRGNVRHMIMEIHKIGRHLGEIASHAKPGGTVSGGTILAENEINVTLTFERTITKITFIANVRRMKNGTSATVKDIDYSHNYSSIAGTVKTPSRLSKTRLMLSREP
nr:hypothetical protein KMWWDNXK_KMWWDNXK_CDS_0002 [Microvirus sp.]